jgi:hypothetical protein
MCYASTVQVFQSPCHLKRNIPETCRELRYIKGLLLTGKLLFLSPQATLPSATHDIYSCQTGVSLKRNRFSLEDWSEVYGLRLIISCCTGAGILQAVGNQQLNAGCLSGLDAWSPNIGVVGVVVSDPQCRIASPLLTGGCHVIFPTITNAVY